MNPLIQKSLTDALWRQIEPISATPWKTEQRKEYELVEHDASEFLLLDSVEQSNKNNLKYLYLHDEAQGLNIPTVKLCQVIEAKANAYKMLLRVYRTARHQLDKYARENEAALLQEQQIDELVQTVLLPILIRYGLAK